MGCALKSLIRAYEDQQYDGGNLSLEKNNKRKQKSLKRKRKKEKRQRKIQYIVDDPGKWPQRQLYVQVIASPKNLKRWKNKIEFEEK